MAETPSSLVRDRLFPLLKEAVGVVSADVPREVADMKVKLETIQASIYDAARTDKKTDDGSKRRVKELTEIALRMEDVIDEYMMLEERQHGDPGCAALTCEPINYCIKTMILRIKIRRMIQDNRIPESCSPSRDPVVFRTQPSPGDQWPSSSRENQDVQGFEATIIGFEAPRDQLVGWLVKGRAERTVISVVGMGGVGKTTLAWNVFNNKEVIGHFDCRAWITVSCSYTIEGLLRDMLDKFYKEQKNSPPQEIFKMGRESMIKKVRSYLQQKRYVIFFDDVWDTSFWDEIEFVAIDNDLGSRIFITTRDMSVAHSCKKSSLAHIYQLKSLDREQSLQLFHKKVFQSDEFPPEELMDISFKIVEKCMDIPLVIVTVAGSLSKQEKTVHNFYKFYQDLNLKLGRHSYLDGIEEIISLSYDDLPYHLKPCFLYFGMYPDDCEVEKKRLICQWIAEGFVKHESEKTLEEVAERYLIELVNRNLVQASSLTIDGKIKGCRVHNLLHDIILNKSKDLAFCHYISEDIDQSNLRGIIRHLSIATNFNDSIGSIESSHVRSLLFFTNEELPDNLVRKIPTKYKLLKVLDFENARLHYAPENLGNLFYLKYLSFKTTQVESLPKSIGLLQNLESLDLRQTRVHEMPKEISKLRKLRHLLGENMSLIGLRGCIGGMTSLQTLNEVQIDNDAADLMISELGKLLQMRNLGLTNIVREDQGSAICSSINKMKHLEELYISTKDDDGVINLDFKSTPQCRCLEKLCLRGKLTKLPESIPGLYNLVHLILSRSKLSEDPLKLLQDLPKLLILSITSEGYVGKTLCFQKGGFKKLKELELRSLYYLSSITIHEGALHSLKKLELENIPQLKIPDDIRHLELEELEVYVQNMPTAFEQRILDVVSGARIVKGSRK